MNNRFVEQMRDDLRTAVSNRLAVAHLSGTMGLIPASIYLLPEASVTLFSPEGDGEYYAIVRDEDGREWVGRHSFQTWGHV